MLILKKDIGTMKVILECERMKHPYTGLYEYCYQLGHALQKYFDEDGIGYYVPKSAVGVFGEAYKYYEKRSIDKLLRRRDMQADVWHSIFQTTRYLKVRSNMKKVLTIQDLNFLYEKDFPGKVSKYLNIVQRNIDRADYVVAISNYTKNDVLKHMELKGKPLKVIHNGCNILDFGGQEIEVNYKPSRPFLFFVGTVISKKNVHVLPCLLVGNDYELVLSGIQSSSYRQKIEDEARKHGVADRVKFTGAITNEEKYWYFKNCLAFAFPSLAEGFGAPPIEAMYFGKPVFLSDRTSLPEIGGTEAYYFENFEPEHMQNVFEKSMNDFAKDLDKPLRLKAHADQFSWGRCAEEYISVYESVMKK